MKVLMVCLGNICRSPLAEGILKNKINSSKVLVDSAGTGGYHIGNAPDPRSITIAKKHGIDISRQKCRLFTVTDFDNFDHIYVMDESNYTNVVKLARGASDKNKVSLLLNVTNLENKEVPDPYYGGVDGFENVFQMIDKACEVIANNINNL